MCTFPAKLYVRFIIIIALGSSPSVVLGDRCSSGRGSLREADGDFEPFVCEDEGRSVVVVGLEGDGCGLPEIICAHSASTSIVDPAVEASGFFSTFLPSSHQHMLALLQRT